MTGFSLLAHLTPPATAPAQPLAPPASAPPAHSIPAEVSRSVAARSYQAPISHNGFKILPMGRVHKLSSPVSLALTFHGASTPIKRRAVVPEFPQSISASPLNFGPRSPHPVIVPLRLPPSCRSKSTRAPNARTADIELCTSALSNTPLRCVVPVAIAPNSTARCDMLLSPDTRTRPLNA